MLFHCLYDAIYTPKRHYTVKRLFPLLDALSTFDAACRGSGSKVMDSLRNDRENASPGRWCSSGTDEAAILAAYEAKCARGTPNTSSERSLLGWSSIRTGRLLFFFDQRAALVEEITFGAHLPQQAVHRALQHF